MAKREPSKEQFLKDVVSHELTISHEAGIYRHLRFKAPKTSNMWFELVTWPGFLTVAGDMGTWTFSRVPDMLTFFRSKELAINASYWAEKIQNGVHGGRDSAKVFDQEVFAERLLDQLKNYYSLDGRAELDTVTAAVKEQVLQREDGNGQHALMRAAAEFECPLEEEPEHSVSCRRMLSFGCICGAKKKRRKFEFDSCELPDGKDYAYHFIWCLYAIVWGIQQYDAQQERVS